MSNFKPTHVSHKRVEAFPINAAEFEADGSGKVSVSVGAERGITVHVPPGFASRGLPAEGDMLLRYEPTVEQPGGYLAHSPRAVFEAGYQLLSRAPDTSGTPAITRGEADQLVEASPAPRVTADGISAKVRSVDYFRAGVMTICIIEMRNGFQLIGKAACASPENYNQAAGERYAYDDAFRQIWAFEAYLLKERAAEPRVPRQISDAEPPYPPQQQQQVHAGGRDPRLSGRPHP